MKSSLTDILVKALCGKKIVQQKGVHENYWGKTITDVYPSWGIDRDFDLCYMIITNAEGNHVFMVDIDFELEVE
jgi:hypothetical protein